MLFPKQNTNAAPFYREDTARSRLWPAGPRDALDVRQENFAPRFGFAYRPFSRQPHAGPRRLRNLLFLCRSLNNISQNSVTGPPAQLWAGFISDTTTPTLNYGGDIGKTPAETFQTVRLGVLTGFENQWLEAYTQQWSFSVGQELGKDFVG